MAEEKFKLPRSSYEEICKIIKAYGRLQQAASLDEVAKLCALNKTGISANNAFLSNVELIEGGKAKSATLIGRELAKALEHELPDLIQENWAKVVNGNDFLGKMAVAVKIRGKMESSALESHIAYSAGEAKSGAVMTGARAVIDMLRAAGVVREHDGQLVAYESVIHSEGARPNSSNTPTPPISIPVSQIFAPPPVAKTGGASLHIELRIDAKPNELDGLGEKIQNLLREINSPDQVADNGTTNDS
ncbi:MAG TPA: hypothetical protein PKK23_17660 [Nitrospirales bacterium]|nr:hypothetical protein [Nitrospiraceae bacterium]HNP30874.1 hypothetical protein [Nitrospirales bacterium]